MGGSWVTISTARFGGAGVRSRQCDLRGEFEFERSVGCGSGIIEGGSVLGCDLTGDVGAMDRRCWR